MDGSHQSLIVIYFLIVRELYKWNVLEVFASFPKNWKYFWLFWRTAKKVKRLLYGTRITEEVSIVAGKKETDNVQSAINCREKSENEDKLQWKAVKNLEKYLHKVGKALQNGTKFVSLKELDLVCLCNMCEGRNKIKRNLLPRSIVVIVLAFDSITV